METVLLKGNKKKHRKQASQKQLVAIQLVSQGMSKSEAMRKAGYSEKTVNTPKQVFTSQAIVTAVDKFKLELKDKGLTTDYMAAKIQEWMDAQDSKGNPDYLIQQNAYKFLKEILIDQEVKDKQPIKKTLTLTEYLQPNTNEDSLSNPIEINVEEENILEDIIKPHIVDRIDVGKEEDKPVEQELEELII